MSNPFPKKTYRDKVRLRLALVQQFLGDRERCEKMLQRMAGKPKIPKEDIDRFYMLLNSDVNVLLDALDYVSRNWQPKSIEPIDWASGE